MRRKRAFTLLEILIAVSVMSFVLIGVTQMTINLTRGFERTSAQLDVDQTAGLAILRMTRDLQEAKEVVIVSPTSLRVYYPQLTAEGTYNRQMRDEINTVDYYRGDPNGLPNPNGTALIKVVGSQAPDVVCEGVTELRFTSSNPSSVDVTIHVDRQSVGRRVETQMIHRAIFLRNY